jgi:hypothetical protein
MSLKSMLHLTNRKLRLLVGLFLAAMFCIQCTTSEGSKDIQVATAVSGKIVGKNSPTVLSRLEDMAKTDHVAALEFCVEHYRNTYRDYTCTFQKQERLGGILGRVQEIEVKFLDKPFSVSMLWTKNQPSQADRLLYVEGKWDNQMIVRPSGLLAWAGPQFRPPDGPEAMKNTLRPVSRFGFERGLSSLIEVYKDAARKGDVQKLEYGYAQVGGRNTLLLSRYLPCKPDYPAWKTKTYIDLEYLTPIMVESYGWDEKHLLISRYLFKNVKFNVGLTSEDFLPEANEMVEPK